jgi:hypothetical protein
LEEFRVGILAHSRHLQTSGWEKIMWGEPPHLMGQFPKAILTALRENAIIMVLGCGLRSGIHGEMESEFNQAYIMEHFYKLAEFSEFQEIDLVRAREFVEAILVLDKFSTSTAQEIAVAAKVFQNNDIGKVVGITAPTHAPRCLNEALKFYSQPGSKIAVRNVSVQSSDFGWAPQDSVVVNEPSHRPDEDDSFFKIRLEHKVLLPLDASPEVKEVIKEALRRL